MKRSFKHTQTKYSGIQDQSDLYGFTDHHQTSHLQLKRGIFKKNLTLVVITLQRHV